MSDDFAELNQIYAPAQAQVQAPAQVPDASSGVPGNNFGGVRSGKNSFASYPTPEAGIGAMLSTLQHHIAKAPQGQLNLYGLVGGLTPQGTLPSDADDPKTLQGGWAPATDHNNPVAYAKGLGGALGLDPYKDTIDPTDSGQMAKLVYAIAKQEHGAKNIPPPEIFQKAVGAALPTPGALDPGTFDDLKSIYTPPSTPTPTPTPTPGSGSGPTAPPKASASPPPATQTYTAKSETAADPTGGANQYNGAWREPAIAGSGVAEGVGNILDLPHNLLSWAGRKAGLPPLLMGILGLGNSPLNNPTASEILHGTGVTGNPALTPQGTGERLLQEGAQGVGASLPLLPVTGPGAALGTLLGGGLGNVAGQEGGPTVTKGLTAVGVPQGVADVAGPIVASVPGAVVGGGMGNMASRAAGALAGGEGPLAVAGAAAPGTTLSTSINPDIQDLAQSASTAGIRIPSQFLAEDASTLPPVPLAALKQTWGDITQKLANSVGLNKRTLFEEDLDTAKAKAGDVMDTALANSTTSHLVTPFGRERTFFGRPNDDTTLREAIAYVPQSSTADRLNLGLWRIWKHMGTEVQLLGQVHDAVYFQVPEKSDLSTIITKALALLETPLHHPPTGRTLVVPGEAKWGWNWASLGPSNPDGLAKWKGKVDRQRTSILNQRL